MQNEPLHTYHLNLKIMELEQKIIEEKTERMKRRKG